MSSHILSDLEGCTLEEDNYIDLPQTFTQPSIPMKKENIPLQKDVEQWPYLHEVCILHIPAEVGLLIGADAYKASEPLQIINSKSDGPYVVKTPLGCVINSPLRQTTTSSVNTEMASQSHSSF